MSRLTILTPLLLGCALAPLASAQDSVSGNDAVSTAFQEWQAQTQSRWLIHVDRSTGTVQHLYGGRSAPAFQPRGDADWFELGRQALNDAYGMFRIADSTLVEDSVKHLDLSRIGSNDKVAVHFRQEVKGVPVVHGGANLIFDAAGGLLSLDSTGLPDVESLSTRPRFDPYSAVTAAERNFAEIEMRRATAIGHPKLVIYAQRQGQVRQARLAWAIELRDPSAEGLPAGRRIYVAADSGAAEILGNDQLVHQQSVSGHVDAWASPGTLPDISSNPEALHPMRYMNVTSPAGNTTTDANGDFTIPNAGGNPVNVTFKFRGTWAKVLDTAGAEYTLTQSFTPGVPANAAMNPNKTANETAEANAYRASVDFHDYIKRIDPNDTTMDFQLLANVNISSTCNAYYNGSSTNFYAAGGGCSNTAYSTVVAHETGHWANDRYGSGNGYDGFGEGNADAWAMYIYDNPIVGEYFFSGGGFIRTGTNTRPYCGDGNGGCYGEVHADGEVLMGALWKVRDHLNTSLGNSAGDLVADTLLVSWMNSYNDGNIDSIIEEHWLTLDDNDGNIFNGTPNYPDIDAGFRDQGFPGIALQLIQIAHTPLGDTTDEIGPYSVTADITSLAGATITSADVVYTVNGGTPMTVAMVNTSGSSWSGDIPGQVSPAQVSYHIVAGDNLGNTASDPRQGEYHFVVGVINTLVFYDFEGTSDQGWTHTVIAREDDWQRGTPQGKSGSSFGVNWQDPTAAYSGSKAWCNDLGNGSSNGSYSANVNNYLESPSMDLTGHVGTKLRFAQWLSVEQGIYDHAKVLVNGNVVWQNPSNQQTTETGWSVQEIDISQWADNNPSVKVRFSLDSDGGLELGGWGLDDFEILTIDPVPGNTNTIVLTGDTVGNVGSTVSYTFTNGPASSPWWAAWSTNTSGTTFGGHVFDLGAPYQIVASGTTSAAGGGAFTSTPLPPGASGMTIYLEVAAQDASGWFDSNPLTLSIN